MPFADTHAMQAHLEEIGRTVATGAHAVLLMDRAGWHTTGDLKFPDNLTPVLLPPRSPELNPTENVWQYLRQTYLSNRSLRQLRRHHRRRLRRLEPTHRQALENNVDRHAGMGP